MGDRANVVIRRDVEGDDRGAVFLYGHWSGYDLPEVVRTALAKRWRWDDPEYLARIVFDVMTEKSHGEETGFGIGNLPPDNEYDFIVLRNERVYRYPEATWTEHGFAKLDEAPSITFEDYIAKARDWDNLTAAATAAA